MDIHGYDGLYQISNEGRVKSFHYGENFLVPKRNNNGYLWVELAKNRARKAMTIHRLVAIHFIANPHCYHEVNHIDENKENNRFDNLEWCTREYNINYSLDRLRKAKGDSCHVFSRKLRRTKPIIQYSIDGQFIKKWDNANTIKIETEKNEWNIVECCRGNRNTAYGYKWIFAQS